MRYTLTFLVILGIMAGCSSTGTMNGEMRFTTSLAKNNLWNDALFQWQQMIARGHESAALYNNVAVALESMGRANEAEEAYQKAMKLAPANEKIKANFRRFKGLEKETETERAPGDSGSPGKDTGKKGV